MNLKKWKGIYVGTGPSSYEKRVYLAAVSQRLRNTDIYDKESHGKAMGFKSFKSSNEHEKYFVIFSLIFIVTRNAIWRPLRAQDILLVSRNSLDRLLFNG